MLWSRRRILAAGLGATLAPLGGADRLPRTGTQWLHEAEALSRRVGSLSPAALAARTRRLLSELDGALDCAPYARDRRPLHAAAAITGVVAAHASRLRGGNPVVYLSNARAHAEAAGDGVARALTILCRLPSGTRSVEPIGTAPLALDVAQEALAAAGTGGAGAHLRAGAQWWTAWADAVTGDRTGAVVTMRLAEQEAGRANWPEHAVLGMRGVVLDRCGRHQAAVGELRRGLAGAQSVGAVGDAADLAVGLGCGLARHGEVDEAATVLVVAATSPACSAGRRAVVRRAGLLVPPGPWREELDAALTG